MRKDQEPTSTIPVDTRPTSLAVENVPRQARRKLGLVALIYKGAIATSLLTGIACGELAGSDQPAPTVDPILLEPHNVPWVNVEIEDKNGDGFYNRTDAYLQEEGNWRFDLNMEPDENGIFWVDEKDLVLARNRVCTIPVPPKYDPDADGHITPKDIAIFENNQGIVEEDPNPNARLDELDGGIVLKGDYQNFEKRNHARVPDTIIGTDPDCEPNS